MMPREIPTAFAPADRSPRSEIRRQADLFKSPQILKQLSDAVADMLLILNENRQIVHANKYVCDVFNVSNEEIWLGLRPGEAMRCLHAEETYGGCGTTKFCRTCGSVKAVLTSQKGTPSVEECRIIQEKNMGSLDLLISASPLHVEGESFTVYSARDITDEKRREALERIFFHDVLNMAGGLKGYLEVLEVANDELRQEFYVSARELMKSLIEEIVAQQELTAAECGTLQLQPSSVHTTHFLKDLIKLYGNHEVAEARELELDPLSRDLVVTTDKRLLQRVVGNMVKNALEATEPGGVVTVRCSGGNGTVSFAVHNEKEIPDEVRLQLFQRSFSTKGQGRGLGTYSIKLLGEKFLGGTVRLDTGKKGTTFSITLPGPSTTTS